jgi:hypothetical protein
MGKSATSQDASLQASETSNADALTAIATSQNANAQTLFNQALPGYEQANQFYGTLASGDPYASARATAPAAQQIATATAGAKANIMNNAPAGGTKALALENADVSQGAQVGKIASQGYLGSFDALSKLAAEGMGASNSMTGQAMQGYTSASGIQSGIIQQNLQQKGATLGAYEGVTQDLFSGPNTGKGASGFGNSSQMGGGGGGNFNTAGDNFGAGGAGYGIGGGDGMTGANDLGMDYGGGAAAGGATFLA